MKAKLRLEAMTFWWLTLPAFFLTGAVSLASFDGEKLLSVDECHSIEGSVLLDTCLIKSEAKASWTNASGQCSANGSRLLQLLINSTYDDQFLQLPENAPGNFTPVWLSFILSRGGTPPKSAGIPFIRNRQIKKYPACVYLDRIAKGKIVATEQSCDSGVIFYWCQYRLTVTNQTTSQEWNTATEATGTGYAAVETTAAGNTLSSISTSGEPSSGAKFHTTVDHTADRTIALTQWPTPTIDTPHSNAFQSTPGQPSANAPAHSSASTDASTLAASSKPSESTPKIKRNPRDPCWLTNCNFGQCISNSTITYHCQCISGFSGDHCQIASGWSTDPIHIYNYVIQDLGNAWVIGTSAATLLIYTLHKDRTPEGILKCHSLLALIIEHTFILLFRSPAISGLTDVWCRTMSLVMYYIRTTHASLVMFHAFHVYYIMTGVTRGEWGWNGRSVPFLFFGWVLFPSTLSFATFLSDPETFGTTFSCMFNWEPNHLSQCFTLFVHLVLALLSGESLEEAHMYRRWQQKYVGEANVNPVHLQAANVGRLGTMVVAQLAPFGFFVSSVAVYTESPIAFTFAFNSNVALGAAILGGYVEQCGGLCQFEERVGEDPSFLVRKQGGPGAVY